MLKVVFRTDASSRIGSGHAMRCLTLAQGLRAEGAEVLIVCREHERHLCDYIEAQGFTVARLAPGNQSPESTAPGRESAGADRGSDAAETRAAMLGAGFLRPEWLIVDHYALDAVWEASMRPDVGRIMAIDDLADRRHDCDVLLDQNLVAGLETRYAGKVDGGATLLLGPGYALLQPGYAALHEQARARTGPVRRILIYFGAADLPNLSGVALSAVIALGRSDIAVDLVVGSVGPHAEDLLLLASGHDNIAIHRELPSLAPLMVAADLAVGAGGTTSWERLCLRLPAVVVTLADNQRAIAAELHRRGLIRWLGDAVDVDSRVMQTAIAECLRPSAFAGDFDELVDGRGEARVRAILTVTQASPLAVRPAALADEDLLLEWANDPETRANSFHPELITPEGHHRWFTARLGDIERCCLFIVETASGVPVGLARFEREGDLWTIGYSIAREFRGRSLGWRVLGEGIMAFRKLGSTAPLVGRVRPNNLRSRKVFERLGFTCAKLDAKALEFRQSLEATPRSA